MSRRRNRFLGMACMVAVMQIFACAAVDVGGLVNYEGEQTAGFGGPSARMGNLEDPSLQAGNSPGNGEGLSPQMGNWVNQDPENTETQAAGTWQDWGNVWVDEGSLAPDIAAIRERGTLVVALPVADMLLFYETNGGRGTDGASGTGRGDGANGAGRGDRTDRPDGANGADVTDGAGRADGVGEVSGIDAELAAGLADSLGVRLQFGRSGETLHDLANQLKWGQVDLVFGAYPMSAALNMYVDFSDPYLETCLSILVQNRELAGHQIEENPLPYMRANPVTVGAVADSAYYEMAGRLFPGAAVVPLPDYQTGYDKIMSGELFAVFSGELEFLSALEREPALALYGTVYSFSDMHEQFRIGTAKDTPQLLDYVNTYLRTYKAGYCR